MDNHDVGVTGYSVEPTGHRLLPPGATWNDLNLFPQAAEDGWGVGRQLSRQNDDDLVDAIAAVERLEAPVEEASTVDLQQLLRSSPSESPTPSTRGDDRYDVHQDSGCRIQDLRALSNCSRLGPVTCRRFDHPSHPFGQRRGIGPREKGRRNRIVHHQINLGRARHEATLSHHMPTADHRHGHDGQTRLDGPRGRCPA